MSVSLTFNYKGIIKSLALYVDPKDFHDKKDPIPINCVNLTLEQVFRTLGKEFTVELQVNTDRTYLARVNGSELQVPGNSDQAFRNV